MIIRLVFEPEKNVNVNHDKMFEFYSQNYLSDFDTVWGGSIMIDNFSKKHYKQEPCYQRYVPSVRGTQELFDKIVKYIKKAKNDEEAEILIGGDYDDSKGYFISPTVILTTNPNYITMTEEIFGPVVTIFIYPDKEWKDILKLVDKTSIYALTGAFISKDKESIDYALKHLRYSAGNFYINDKPSGAVVGQQPFGGSRASGTNDKAGSKLNLLRWVSPRLIKENLSPPTDYPYPYME